MLHDMLYFLSETITSVQPHFLYYATLFPFPIPKDTDTKFDNMTTTQEHNADAQYEAQSDANVEVSGNVTDNSYISRTGQKDQVPVVGDEQGVQELGSQDSDAQLGMLQSAVGVLHLRLSCVQGGRG